MLLYKRYMQMFSACRKIEIGEFPFPYVVINGLFTESVYQEILAHRPSQTLFTEIDNKANLGRRFEWWLNSRNIAALNPKSQAFWDSVARQLNETGASIFDQFYNRAMKIDGGVNCNQGAFRLTREVCPFTLPPHVDNQGKSYVVIIYIPHPNNAKHRNGTILYKKMGSLLVPVRKIKYKPNSALLLPRTPDSWHGGNWHDHFIRDTLHLYYWQQSPVV